MTWGTTPKNRRGIVINWRSESFPPQAPRCGVITDGFYEWSGPKEARQPHWFHRPDHALVILAGMWKMQEQPEGGFVQSFVVLTTRANAMTALIHDRMPVRFDEWLDAKTPETALRSKLRPAPEDWLVAELASPLVNNVKNDAPELLAGLIEFSGADHGTEKYQVRAVQVSSAKRKRLFDAQAKILRFFNDYQAKTKREIPAFTLNRI